MKSLPNLRKIDVRIVIGVAALLVWIAPVPALQVTVRHITSPPPTPDLPANHTMLAMHNTNARPMFAQTRRPLPPVLAAGQAVSKPVPTTNGMVLLGILRDPSQVVALVKMPGDQGPRRVEVGAKLGDWVIKQITNDRLILRSDNVNAELLLPRPVMSESVMQRGIYHPRVLSSTSSVP